MLAEKCGSVFESLWDAVNASSNKLETLGNFGAGEIVLADWAAPQLLPHEIEVRDSRGAGQTIGSREWKNRIAKFAAEGWQIDNLEFRHNRFEVDEKRGPAQSHFYFAARVTNPTGPKRAIIEGNLVVDWDSSGTNRLAAVKRIDASRLQIRSRSGEPSLREAS